MGSLNYSYDALNVKAAFYGAERMLYVEGQDDLLFWEFILKKFNKSGFQVEDLGGKEEVIKRINEVREGLVDCIIATDADFNLLNPDYCDQESILLTYGHSIENSIITAYSIIKLSKVYARTKAEIDRDTVESWLAESEAILSDLIICDAANDVGGLGISVLGDNCARFMTSNKSAVLCKVKIDTALSYIKADNRIEAEISTILQTFSNCSRSMIDFLRGHFYATMMMRKANSLIRSLGGARQLNNDSFFSSAFLAFEQIFDERHPHYNFYQSQVDRI